jgi:protein SCO1
VIEHPAVARSRLSWSRCVGARDEGTSLARGRLASAALAWARLAGVWLPAGWLLCATLAIALEARAAMAPAPAEGISFDQRLGASLPLLARFTDQQGRTGTLERFVQGETTVLLLGYQRCPNLCSAVRSSLEHALQATGLAAERDYRVLAVSIDADESSAPPGTDDASAESAHTIVAERGWHFLHGRADAIAALAQSIGFRYRYDADIGQYAHPAGFVIVTPKGAVSRYFLGVDFSPRQLEASLIDARRERVGSPVRELLMRCLHYDPDIGRYSLAVERAAQLVAALTCAALLVLLRVMQRAPRAKASGEGGAP